MNVTTSSASSATRLLAATFVLFLTFEAGFSQSAVDATQRKACLAFSGNAPATDSARSQLTGRWAAVNRSQGGMGSMWEFKADGTFTMSPGVIVDMPYRLEGDTLTLPPGTTLPNAKPQVMKVRFQGDRLYEKFADIPEMSFVRIKDGQPGDAPIVGQWRLEPLSINQRKTGASAANSDQTQTPSRGSAPLWQWTNNATYTYTREGILKLRIAFRPVSGCYEMKGRTFSLDMSNEKGETRTFTGQFELRDGKLYLTQPDGHTKDVYVRDDVEEP